MSCACQAASSAISVAKPLRHLAERCNFVIKIPDMAYNGVPVNCNALFVVIGCGHHVIAHVWLNDTLTNHLARHHVVTMLCPMFG